MPEGDTIYRSAKTLQKAIGGKIILRARSPLPGLSAPSERLAGARVLGVEARGKHLLIHIEGGFTLSSHMRMTGSWHIYRPGERWQKPERMAQLVLETSDFVAVCFNAPIVELLRSGKAKDKYKDPGAAPRSEPSSGIALGSITSRAGRELAGLGPDLLKDDFDAAEVLRRLRQNGDLPIGEALLNQRILAGIGNVYKSETLFLCRADPLAPVASFTDAELQAIVSKARELMSRNLDGRPRTTRWTLGALSGPRYWVYKRSGEPCLECGGPIRMRRQGAAARSTYWCPRCQPEGGRARSGPET
jgi:endonuclease-8